MKTEEQQRHREYREAHRGNFAVYQRNYRLRYPDKRREDKRRASARHNAETLLSAQRGYYGWDADDISYLALNATLLTARDIAFALGRSYLAVLVKASRLKIPLMTEDKRHGQLVTGS